MEKEELRQKAKEVVREKKRAERRFKIAIGIIVILLIVVAAIFIIKPQFEQYVSRKQTEAMQETVAIILQTVQQNGYIQFGEGENAMILVEAQQ